MMFDGATDSLVVSVLNSIEWRIRYGVLQGDLQDSPAFRQTIPGAVDENGISKSSGEFTLQTGILAGEQTTTISWYSDEGTIRFRIIEITRAK